MTTGNKWKCVSLNEPTGCAYYGGKLEDGAEPNADADVDALLEVIKQKDAIIDNCLSSLEEYRQKSYRYYTQIEGLKAMSNPDLWKEKCDLESKLRTAENQLKVLNFKWDNRWSKTFEDAPTFPVILLLGGFIGFLVGICL